MGLDDAHAKRLGGFLVAVMPFLFSYKRGGESLYVIEDVEQWVAEEL